jgi:ribonuclease HI
LPDLRRSARLLDALAHGAPLAQAAERADFDLPQAKATLRELAERLNVQAAKVEKLKAEEERKRQRARHVAANTDEMFFVFDGGSRGNPGPAAGVALACDAGGGVLIERARFLEKSTNNVAEYHGLLLALELAAELGVKRLRLRGDSELVVKQLRGEYKVKHPHLKPLFIQALRGLRTFDSWDIRHIPREENEDADRYVNQVLNQHAPQTKKKR